MSDPVETSTSFSSFFFLKDAPFMMIDLKTMWNANARAKNNETRKETMENLSANSTSIGVEASGTLDMKMEFTANVSTDGKRGKNISGSWTVEAYEGFDLVLTFVTESYPAVSNQHWTKPEKVNNNSNVTKFQESYSIKDTRLETPSYVSSDIPKTCSKALDHLT